MLQTLVLLAHVIFASLMIVLVLLQRGKGADAGTGFGAGASGTVFGSRGTASFFSRATAVLATMFYGTSLALAYFAAQTPGSDSLLEGSVLESTVIESGSAADELPDLTPAGNAELPAETLDDPPAPGPAEN